MTKISKTIRASIVKIVDESSQYDARTVQISRDGEVSALKDADKTYAGNDPMRYLVGHVSEMIADDEGAISDGW